MVPRPRMPLVGLVLILGGCLQADGQGAPREPLFASSPFGAFEVADVASLPGGAEPGIQAAPDGTLYVIAWTRMFTQDGRGAWRELRTPFAHNGDSDLAIDGAGTLHVVGMGLAKAVASGDPAVPYWRSHDRGATWDLVADLSPGRAIDRPWIAAAPDGRLVVVWNDFTGQRQSVRSSGDGGDHWGARTDLDAPWLPLISRPVFQGDRAILAMMPGAGGRVAIAQQAQAGAPWRVADGPVGSLEGFLPGLAVDGVGALHLVGVQARGGAQQVVHAGTDPAAGGWGPYEQVSAGLQAVMAWPIPLHRGVAVAFYQSAPTPDERLLPLQLAMPQEPPQQWHAVVAAPSGSGWTLRNTTADPIHVGPMCTRPAGCDEGAAPFYDYFEAVARSDGGIAVAHVVHGEQRGGQHGLVAATA